MMESSYSRSFRALMYPIAESTHFWPNYEGTVPTAAISLSYEYSRGRDSVSAASCSLSLIYLSQILSQL